MSTRPILSWWQKVTSFLRPRTSAAGPHASPSLPSRPPRVFPGPFEESDHVLIRGFGSDRTLRLTRPLSPSGSTNVAKGSIPHSSLIGALPGSTVLSTQSHPAIISTPTLEDYILLTRRLVTPIYPPDAALIVSLLDIHAHPTTPSTPVFEILESGTGHGSLTLHLARALAAFNPPSSSRRSAVLYSLDASARHSAHAAKLVRAFRRGIYAAHVEFSVGRAGAWAARSYRGAGLAHAVLDLPGPEEEIAAVARAVRPGGKVVVFTPSVTGVLECLRRVKGEDVPLRLERTLELGNNGASGGREWDLRAVVPRRERRREEEGSSEGGEGSVTGAVEESERRVEDDAEVKAETQDLKWVCRPKVGDRINGGGFLGVFVRKADRDDGK